MNELFNCRQLAMLPQAAITAANCTEMCESMLNSKVTYWIDQEGSHGRLQDRSSAKGKMIAVQPIFGTMTQHDSFFGPNVEQGWQSPGYEGGNPGQ